MVKIKIPKPRSKIAQRHLLQRQILWPDIDETYLWSRHTHDGFSTIPRTMPLIQRIMDDMSNGKPVSGTYLELWCRSFDGDFVTLSKPIEMAFHSGFTGQRGERTWKDRLKILDKLKFISLKAGPSGPASYALIFNPYHVIRDHHDAKTTGLHEGKYNALLARALEIGDDSLTPEASIL